MKLDNMKCGLRFLAACAVFFGTFTSAHAAGKPNILILWGDDIGWNNPSCYHRGMMGLPDAQHCTMDPFEKYDMTFNGAVSYRLASSSPGKYAGPG